MRRGIAAALVTLAVVSAAWAEDVRVKRIAVDVEPYYAAAQDPEGAPRIAVSKRYDRLLASSRRDDIERARDLIAKEWDTISPMALMVLAIRLYDVGLRDDAVYWFYVAKNRFVSAMRVADMQARELGDVDSAMRSFVDLAGPVINGYAFCDIEKQKVAARDALKWTIDHPYTALLDARVPAQSGDRKDNFRRSFNEMMESLQKEQAYLASMANVDELKKKRRESGADEKYCWRS